MTASCLLCILVAGANPETPGASITPPTAVPAARQARVANRSRQAIVRRRTRAASPRLAGAGSNAARLIDLIQTTVAPDEWEPPAAIGIFGGGGSGPIGGGAAAPGANPTELIDLIQTTIDPFSWYVNGGPGTIMPFGP